MRRTIHWSHAWAAEFSFGITLHWPVADRTIELAVDIDGTAKIDCRDGSVDAVWIATREKKGPTHYLLSEADGKLFEAVFSQVEREYQDVIEETCRDFWDSREETRADSANDWAAAW